MQGAQGREWTIFSTHGLVLCYLAIHPTATLRDASAALRITERQLSRIITDLVDEGMLRVSKNGRRNYYTVNFSARTRHPLLAHVPLGRFIAAVTDPAET
ncbi:MAG TPA: hypothetical protein VIL01_04565 [Thermomicrobiales bacterium]